MQDFTPWSALAGGALIGLAASVLLILSGRVAGVSGIVGGLLLGPLGDKAWRALFVVGLVAAGLLAAWLRPELIGSAPRSLATLALAGLLVGIGTRIGNGCTSGHGVCGISRLSVRSLVATFTFVFTAMLVVLVLRLVGGGS
ncbi:MAG TPA: YeeE/YedE thiosulfate transporter family protein [Polyangiaceae bacterium]|nr:YeeE/YedE thiosulfate transporter family protein [Polyangiaceae bacterium]